MPQVQKGGWDIDWWKTENFLFIFLGPDRPANEHKKNNIFLWSGTPCFEPTFFLIIGKVGRTIDCLILKNLVKIRLLNSTLFKFTFARKLYFVRSVQIRFCFSLSWGASKVFVSVWEYWNFHVTLFQNKKWFWVFQFFMLFEMSFLLQFRSFISVSSFD